MPKETTRCQKRHSTKTANKKRPIMEAAEYIPEKAGHSWAQSNNRPLSKEKKGKYTWESRPFMGAERRAPMCVSSKACTQYSVSKETMKCQNRHSVVPKETTKGPHVCPAQGLHTTPTLINVFYNCCYQGPPCLSRARPAHKYEKSWYTLLCLLYRITV